MARVSLTPNLRRFVDVDSIVAPGGSLRDVLDAVFAAHPVLRGYVVDDQGHLRKHMIVFIDNQAIADRETFADPVGDESEVWIFQALSGG